MRYPSYQDHPEVVTALAEIISYTDDRDSTQEELERQVVSWLNGANLGAAVDALVYAVAGAVLGRPTS